MNRSLVSSPAPVGVLRALRGRVKGIDPLLCYLLGAVMAFGLVILYSAVDGDGPLFRSQLLHLVLGVLAMAVASQFSPLFYLRWAPWLYMVVLFLLLVVLVAGIEVKGAARWLEVPGLGRFQPSEFAKLALPMMIAWYFHDRPLPPSLKEIAVTLMLVALPAGCILVQPDLGTTVLVVAAGLGVILLAGVYWRWIGFALLGGAALAPAMWYGLKEYQRQRIITLFDPESDPLGAGWSIIQSITALGSGGFFGKGLGLGTQSQLRFLPESHTDFIIAVVGEELGFLGVVSLLALYVAIGGRVFFIAAQTQHTFSRLLAGALGLVFFVTLLVNIAMVAGLLPVVGVPLPLVSYGGTSVITILAGFGVVMSIHSHRTG